MKKRKKKSIKKRKKIILVAFLIIFFLIYYFHFCQNEDNPIEIELPIISNKAEEKLEKQKEVDYNNCINKTYTDDELIDEIRLKMAEIDSLIINNKYNVSVYYEDINTGFNYKYKSDKVYYGCSLIKLVDALYLIDKATLGEIDLDQEGVVYEAKYKMGYSMGMAKRKIGEKINLRDLITYAITLSDNSAHLMLIDYIGFSNLKNYGESLGAKVILTGGDNFGNQTADDTNIYLKKAYQIIMENEEYGEFLKSIMDNDERNDFNTDTIRIYHKYGSYDNNYHDIGLSLEQRPYTISIFTLHEYSNHKEVVQNIHAKVRELRDLFYENRQKSCYDEIYGDKKTDN